MSSWCFCLFHLLSSSLAFSPSPAFSVSPSFVSSCTRSSPPRSMPSILIWVSLSSLPHLTAGSPSLSALSYSLKNSQTPPLIPTPLSPLMKPLFLLSVIFASSTQKKPTVFTASSTPWLTSFNYSLLCSIVLELSLTVLLLSNLTHWFPPSWQSCLLVAEVFDVYVNFHFFVQSITTTVQSEYLQEDTLVLPCRINYKEHMRQADHSIFVYTVRIGNGYVWNLTRVLYLSPLCLSFSLNSSLKEGLKNNYGG